MLRQFDGHVQRSARNRGGSEYLLDDSVFETAQRRLEAALATRDKPAPGGKAKASKGKGRAPAVKGERKPGRPRQGR